MSRGVVALDLETHLVREGLLTPPVVCASVACEGAPGRLVAPGETRAEKVAGAIAAARELLLDDGVVLAGANIPYDFGCLCAESPDLLPLVFAAYAAGRVHDVQVAQALHAVAAGDHGRDPRTGRELKGRYSLQLCVELVLGRNDAKARDRWRLMYALLGDVPAEDWPEEARLYPVDDAENTLAVALAQLRGGGAGPTPGPHLNLGDLAAQCESHWAMHLGAVWGLRVDGERARELRRKVEVDHADFMRRHSRFFRAGKFDRQAAKRAVAIAYSAGSAPCPACAGVGKVLSLKTGNPVFCKPCSGTGLELEPSVPRTPSGGVQTDKDALSESGDPDLASLADNEPEKIRDTYLPWLEQGSASALCLRPNPLVASGRTSYDGLVQLIPREGGVRECFRARGAWCGHREETSYLSVDYAAIELVALAQVCLWTVGRSRMAEVIQESGDPGALHTAFGARLAGRSYEEMTAAVKAGDKVAKNYRWAAKAINFGSPGGMGSAKFVLTQRKKNAGSTTTSDGEVTYPGIRFCVLLDGARRCGEEKVSEWKGRDVPALCRRCLEIVDGELRPSWFREWPEIREYHKWVSAQVDAGEPARCLVPDGEGGSAAARVRGGVDFTNYANQGFQGLAADGGKAALRAVTRECYLGKKVRARGLGLAETGEPSPLLGARVPFFLHDELFLEVPRAREAAAARRAVELMEEVMQAYVPDVPVRAESALSLRWSKAASGRWDASGELVPWDLCPGGCGGPVEAELARGQKPARASHASPLCAWFRGLSAADVAEALRVERARR